MNFELQPNLQGHLLKLRPLDQSDFDALFMAASDPLIWEQHPQSDRYKKEVFQKFFAGAMESKGGFAIIDLKTNRIVGSSRYYNLDTAKNQITIGYTFLARDMWGGDYNRELKSLMLKHAFRFVDMVVFEIGESNIRSRKAIEKIGASLLERRTLDDRTHMIYGLQKSNFTLKS